MALCLQLPERPESLSQAVSRLCSTAQYHDRPAVWSWTALSCALSVTRVRRISNCTSECDHYFVLLSLLQMRYEEAVYR